MQLIRKYNKGVIFLLCVIDIYSKYEWVVFLKNKNGITTTNAFQKYLDRPGCKPNKLWVDEGSAFNNEVIVPWQWHWNVFNTQRVKICWCRKSCQNFKGQELQAYDSSIKHVYIDKLDEVVDKYNNTYHRIIIMKPDHVKQGTDIGYSLEHNDKTPKFKMLIM